MTNTHTMNEYNTLKRQLLADGWIRDDNEDDAKNIADFPCEVCGNQEKYEGYSHTRPNFYYPTMKVKDYRAFSVCEHCQVVTEF